MSGRSEWGVPVCLLSPGRQRLLEVFTTEPVLGLIICDKLEDELGSLDSLINRGGGFSLPAFADELLYP